MVGGSTLRRTNVDEDSRRIVERNRRLEILSNRLRNNINTMKRGRRSKASNNTITRSKISKKLRK